MAEKAPLILFVYNRPNHARVVVESLLNNPEAADSSLFVFSDAPRSDADRQKENDDLDRVAGVRRYIRAINGFRQVRIFENETNIGLARSVIAGVNRVFLEYDRVIVVEDDLMVASAFLRFMNEALEFYKDDSRIYSLGGYSPPVAMPAGYMHDVYLSYRCSSWGWATWKNRWENADWDVKDYALFKKNRKMQMRFSRGGRDLVNMLDAQMNHKIDSWAVRWDYAHFKNNAYALKPCRSLVQTTGTDGSGMNSRMTDYYSVDISRFGECVPPRLTSNVDVHKTLVDRLAAFYERRPASFLKRVRLSILNFMKKLLLQMR